MEPTPSELVVATPSDDEVISQLLEQGKRDHQVEKKKLARKCQRDCGIKEYFRNLRTIFGGHFLLFLVFSQFILKGLVTGLVGSLVLPLYKGVFGVDAAQLQMYTMIVWAPWSLKPLLGLVSDLVLCGGYHKRWWLVQTLVMGVIGAGLSFLAFTQRSAIGFALCLAAVQLELSFYDLMSEAHYSAIARDNEETGSDIVTFVQGLQAGGYVAAMLMVGPMSDAQLFAPMLVIVAVLVFLPLFPTLSGWLPEERQAPGCRPRLVGRAQLYRDRWMILIIALTGLAAPITSTLANTGDPLIALSLALVLTLGSLAGAWMVFPRMIARIATYRVLVTLAQPSLGSAMDYFYVATPDCVANGPHFSYAYYVTVAGLIGSVAAFLGVLLYQKTLSNLNFRTVVMITNVLNSGIGASDLFLVLRINTQLGIPDWAAYIVGEAVMEPLIGMLNYIPDSTLLSKAVPLGMEGSAYAFMAGLSNYASMISRLSGALAFELAGIRTSVPCNFDALWWLVLVCHVAAPGVAGLLAAWFLIPAVGQRDRLE